MTRRSGWYMTFFAAGVIDDDPHPLARALDRTEIVCEWHFHPEAMANPVFRLDNAVTFWDMTNRQDWHVSEQMQLASSPRLPPRSLLPPRGSAARVRPVDPVRGRMTGRCWWPARFTVQLYISRHEPSGWATVRPVLYAHSAFLAAMAFMDVAPPARDGSSDKK